jgi:hypothetical protein
VTDPVFYGKPLTFNEKRHMYFWGGKHLPSVTTIISRLDKPLLIQWAANCTADYIRQRADEWPDGYRLSQGTLSNLCEEARYAHRTIKEDAGDIGTRVHRYARAILEGKSPEEPLDGPAQKAIEAFWQWVEMHRIEPIAVERRVMSESYLYAGTCDFFGHIDGVLSILDFKTGKGVYDEAWWQTSGYEVALAEELGNLPVPAARWIVHLNKESGDCVPHSRTTIEDWQADRAVWLSLVKLDQALRAARKHPQPKRAA